MWWPADNDIEMMLGAILVQNTRWRNAEIALNRLKNIRILIQIIY